MPNSIFFPRRGFESKSVIDTRATMDKNDPFLNVGFKHGKKWVDKNGAKCNMEFGCITKNTPTRVWAEGSACVIDCPPKKKNKNKKKVPYVVLYPQSIVVEFLTLLPARAIKCVLQRIEEFCFLLTLTRCQCLQDSAYSTFSGHIFWFQSIASIPGLASEPAQNARSLQVRWGTGEHEP